MLLPKQEDALGELAKQRGLTQSDCILIEKFLDLKPASRQAVLEYMKQVVSALSDNRSVSVLPTAPTSTPNHTLTVEEEARAEADQHRDLVYQQLLSEKGAAVGMSSESSGPKAGGGIAEQA